MKTRAMETLDREMVEYKVVTYDSKVEKSALESSLETGIPLEKIYKTLVLKGDKNGHFVCVVSGENEVNLKKVAKLQGEKKVSLIDKDTLYKVTGYRRGGCSPFGMKKNLKTYIDKDILEKEEIVISGGKIGIQLILKVEDLKGRFNVEEIS